MRKPTQIAINESGVILALCDDESLWLCNRDDQFRRQWNRLPDIPQDEPEPATSPDVVKALRELEKCEREYRKMHDTLGSGHIRTGHAWDQMRRAGDAAREVLKRIDGQEEPR